jgi:hypothetical protein
MARPKKTEATAELTPVPVESNATTPNFTEKAYGLARKKVLDKATGEERVRSFVVEIPYDPTTGATGPAQLTIADNITDATNRFKIEVAHNVFKFED